MKRTLISLTFAAATLAAGSAVAQTAVAGGANVILPPGGANAANVMITSNGPVQADTTIAQVVANAGVPMVDGPRMPGQAGWAQRRIEMDGYKGVRDVTRGPDGRWHANAMRGSTPVRVAVDRAGRVSSL
jgi:hypothetical protein